MRLSSEEVCAFVGKRGSGKSTRAKALVHELVAHGQRVVAFDYHDEWSKEGAADKQVRLGPLRDRMTFTELLEEVDFLDNASLGLAVVPDAESDRREVAQQFQRLAYWVRQTGRVVLVAEEVGAWGEFAQDDLDDLACQSRHDEVPLIFVAQRMVQIPKTARTQITRLNSGRQDDPSDLRALADIGGEEFARNVSQLGKGESAEWEDSWAQAPSRAQAHKPKRSAEDGKR